MRPSCSALVNAASSTTGPREVLIRYALSFISARRSALTMPGLVVQRTAHRQHVGFPEELLEPDQTNAEIPGDRRIGDTGRAR